MNRYKRTCKYCNDVFDSETRKRTVCNKCKEISIEKNKQRMSVGLSRERKEKEGYILIKVKKKYVLEHRFVVEKYLKRPLKKNEVVHHIDENKKNNAIDNLMLFSSQTKHSKFHTKMRQYGYLTNPMKKQINDRWKGLKE